MLKRFIMGIGTFLMLAGAVGLLYFVFASPYQVKVVHTGSMGRTIPSGSAVIVHEDQYRVGQAVTFTVHGQTVTHRLVSIAADGTITTKGDANRSADPWHPPKSNIIGGVVAAPQHLGWWLFFFRQPTGGLSLLLLLVSAWLLWGSDQTRAYEANALPA